MKTNSIFYSVLILLIFIGCQSQKRPIKSQSEFQKQQNSFFKDASKSPLKPKDLKVFRGSRFFPNRFSICCRGTAAAYSKYSVF